MQFASPKVLAKLLVIRSFTNQPEVNLEFEEHLLNNADFPAVLFTYVNSPCVVMGRNNKKEEWVFVEEVQKAQIPLLRRVTGGGTVYHDLGTHNYSIILAKELLEQIKPPRIHLMEYFRELVIDALSPVVKLEKSGKSDIFLNSRKVGGSAGAIKKHKVLFHGTLLLTVDYSAMERFLPVPPNRDKCLTHRRFLTSFEQEGVKIGAKDIEDLLVRHLSRILYAEPIFRQFGGEFRDNT